MELKEIVISSDKTKLQLETVQALLNRSTWATKRSKDTIAKSIQNSLCFGAYSENQQVAFARVVTDYCTFAYLCDVYVDEKHRGLGISKRMVEAILKHESLQGLKRFSLVTDNAHELYKKYGFKNVGANRYMEILNEQV